MKYNFVFVILNYNTYDDTVKCVDSIKKYCTKTNIVIVDNNSSDNSGDLLKKNYKNSIDIDVILNKSNLGFAKGNNVGFKFAKERYNPDFIILCNSDIEILKNDFCEKVIEEFKESNFAVMGPRELNLNNVYFSPQMKMKTKQQIINLINYHNKILNNELNIFDKIKYEVKSIFKYKNKNSINVNKKYFNIVLHGEFLIFSRIYIEKFDGLDDCTTFYEEEEFLAHRIKKYNLISVYSPNITIFHKRKVSTKKTAKTKRDRDIFVAKNEIDSLNKLLDKYYIGDEDDK